MNRKGTLWIDLTMLHNWQGQLTGIQRVEYNLARRFARRDYAKFCIFDKLSREFYEYDFDGIESKIESLQAASVPEVSIRNAKRSLAAGLKSAIGPLLPLTAKRQIKSAYRKVKRNPRKVNRPVVHLTAADSLLILSGDWSDDIFHTVLSAKKAHTSFKIFQIVYDLLPAMQPAFFVPGMPEQVTNYMAAIFKISDSILAISEATKSDVMKFQKTHQLPACPIKVLRLGEDFAERKPMKPDLPLSKDSFLLCVGTVEARKNHTALYYVVREAMRRGVKVPPIVIAGKQGWMVDDLLYLVKNDPEIRDRILFLSNGTDSEIAWLFQNCQLTLYPSFYEGWGLPIAESLYYGKLCLSSDSSSMPEIAAELIDYYSPNDPVAILDCILKYIDDPKLLEKKERQIKQGYKPTGWDATFAQVEVYISKLRAN